MKILGMIMTYNNVDAIKTVLNKIPKNIFNELIVTDDCSTDGTSFEYEKMNFAVYKNEKNLGYGGNAKNGLKNALKFHDFDYLVEIHGDYAQFNPIAIFDALEHMRNGVDFIIGSRFTKKGLALEQGMSRLRYYSNIILSNIAESIFKLGISEYHTGFRIFSKNYLKNTNWINCSNGHLFSFETIALVPHNNLTIKEIPCECDYLNDHTSISIKNGLIFTFLHFITMLQYKLSKYKIYLGPFKS